MLMVYSEKMMTTAARPQVGATHATRQRSWLTLLIVLFKLRVVSLLVFASVGGAMIASHGAPALGDLLILLLTGTLSAAGASALNQYVERHKDGAMKRTSRRPLVTGEVRPAVALLGGLALIAAAILIALAVGNPALAFFLGLGAFIYVGIYTIWLKPRSVLNVVIGGAAGSAAVMSGGAAVGAWSDPGVIVLAALLFTWSPIHFWSLALAYRADYQRASMPMLPVVASARRAVGWMVLHAAATGAFGLALAAHGALGWAYLVPVAPVTLWLLVESGRLIHDYTGPRAMSVFKVSNIYLSVILAAIVIVSML